MPPDSSPSLTQELTAQAEWLRRLARRLVRDDAAAEDVAQEVALAALRAPPAADVRRSWLARVAGNLARRGWRSAALRAGSERAAARPESVPGAEESAARLELVKLVADELARIDEPFRTALVQRFYDDRSAAEIAREAGVPAPTVRWRIQRGLSELRARLDRRHGGDGIQWRLALLPLARGTPGGASTLPRVGPALVSAVQGVMAMQFSTQVVAAGALVLAVGIGVLWWRTKDGAARAEEAVASGGAPSLDLVAPAASSEAPAADVPLASAREPAVDPRSAPPEPAPARAPATSVDGRCIDARLLPVSGAKVVEVGAAGSEALSARDGTFELACVTRAEAARVFRVEARGLGTRFVEARVASGTTTHLGDVALVAGGGVVGRVVDERGAPFSGALVTVTGTDLWVGLEAARRSGPPSERVLTARSAHDGRFRLEDVPNGMVRVWASSPGLLHAVSGAVEVPPDGATEELELVLESRTRADRIAGVVLDPDGRPVPGAQLMYIRHARLGDDSASFPADEHGRFDFGAASDSTYDLYIGDPEDRWLQIEVAGVKGGGEELELRFEEWHAIEVAVRGAGKPVEAYALCALEEDGGLASGTTFCEPHPGGRETLLSARRTFRVHVDAPGFAPAEQGPFEPAAPPRTLAFELVPEPGLRGRVTVYGEPVTGAKVTLHAWVVGQRIEHGGYPALQAPYELGRAITDAEGRFVLSPRSARTFVVRAEADDLAAADSGPLEFEPARGRDGLELALTRGGALEGRVLVAPGRDPSGVIVALNRGDTCPRTLRSDAEGRFRFERLMPGRWHLARGKVEFVAEEAGTAHSGGAPATIPFDCVVVDGETTDRDLDLRAWEPCAVRGELAFNGQPASGWLVTVWPGDASAVTNEPPSTATDARGVFALDIDDAGPARFSFRPPVELAGSDGGFEARVVLTPGPNPWHGDFDTGSVEGTLGPGCKGWLLFYVSGEEVEPYARFALAPDADGVFRLEHVPAGSGSIRRLDRTDDAVSWTTLVEFDVRVRGTRTVEVP